MPSRLLGSSEPLAQWVEEIQHMRELVLLWDRARTGRAADLREFVEWDGRKGVRYIGPHVSGARKPLDRTIAWIATEHEPEQLARFAPGGLVAPAMSYIQRLANRKLGEHGVTARLLWDQHRSRLNLHMVPSNLIGCIWLQFARAVDGNRDYRQCEECRKWFEATPQVTRSDRRFCTPSCKASAHRKKIAEARKMYADGVSVSEISKRLGAASESVKGWVRQ